MDKWVKTSDGRWIGLHVPLGACPRCKARDALHPLISGNCFAWEAERCGACGESYWFDKHQTPHFSAWGGLPTQDQRDGMRAQLVTIAAGLELPALRLLLEFARGLETMPVVPPAQLKKESCSECGGSGKMGTRSVTLAALPCGACGGTGKVQAMEGSQ